MARRFDPNNPDDPNDPEQARQALLDGLNGPDPTAPLPPSSGPNPAAPDQVIDPPTMPWSEQHPRPHPAPAQQGITDPTVRSPELPPSSPPPDAGGQAPPQMFGGGLTATTPFTNNQTPRIYKGADGNMYTDDKNQNSVSGFVPYTPPTAPTAPQGSPIEQTIDALYKKYGVSDGGNGSGFADRAYWLAHPSEISNGRLEADLNGTGTDQPTGTPGAGNWSRSGAADRAKWGSAAPAGPVPGAAPPVPGPSAPPVPSQAGGASSAPAGPDPMAALTAALTNQRNDAQGFSANIRQILLSQLQGLGNTSVDETSPNIAPGISAYTVSRQRALQRTKEANAERHYAQGTLNTGGFDQAQSQAGEQAGQDTANFTGQAVFQEAQAKRQQLAEMLRTATQYGLTDQAQRIQQQIALIDASLRDKGLNQQHGQFGDQLGFNYAQLQAQQNRDAVLAGLNG